MTDSLMLYCPAPSSQKCHCPLYTRSCGLARREERRPVGSRGTLEASAPGEGPVVGGGSSVCPFLCENQLKVTWRVGDPQALAHVLKQTAAVAFVLCSH